METSEWWLQTVSMAHFNTVRIRPGASRGEEGGPFEMVGFPMMRKKKKKTAIVIPFKGNQNTKMAGDWRKKPAARVTPPLSVNIGMGTVAEMPM